MVRAWTELRGIFFLLKWFIPGVWLFIFKFYHFIKSSERKFWILKNSEFLLFDGGPMHTRDVRTISSCYCPTIFTFLSAVQKPFIFWVVFQHCLRSTLHFMFLSDEEPTFKMLYFTFYTAVHQPFYISICIWKLPTQHTTFYISLWQRANVQNVRFYFLYRQYTKLFMAVHQTMYLWQYTKLFICIWTLPTQHTTFILFFNLLISCLTLIYNN